MALAAPIVSGCAIKSPCPPIPSPQRAGKQRTSYYRARYYDVTSGRFLAEDPVTFLGGHNFYVYVGNWPTLYSDPLGLAKVCNISACRAP